MSKSLNDESKRLDTFACAAIPAIMIRSPRLNPGEIADEAYRVALAMENRRGEVLLPRVESDEKAETILRDLTASTASPRPFD